MGKKKLPDMLDREDRNNLYFLQEMFQFMSQKGILCTFQEPPRLDRLFWDCASREMESGEAETLEAIAACLQEATSDFYCIDQIIALLEGQGFSTGSRHDFS